MTPTSSKTRAALIADDVARVLATLCDVDTVAGLLNATLCRDDDPRLSDYQLSLANAVFNRLCALRPEAIAVAQGRE